MFAYQWLILTICFIELIDIRYLSVVGFILVFDLNTFFFYDADSEIIEHKDPLMQVELIDSNHTK